MALLLLTSLLSPCTTHALQEAFDGFDSGGYMGGTGWTGNWIETDDGASGPGSGLIINDGTRLVFVGGTPQASISRAVDLAGVGAALLKFDISSDGPGPMEVQDEFGVYVSSDAGGNEIPGVANGAVAVLGAATLSGYFDNEYLARAIVKAQLHDGATLGEALHAARQEAARRGLRDVAINWALLGDPTLLLDHAGGGR